MYNLNYAPTTLGVQSWREIICGGTRTKKVQYRCDRWWVLEVNWPRGWCAVVVGSCCPGIRKVAKWHCCNKAVMFEICGMRWYACGFYVMPVRCVLAWSRSSAYSTPVVCVDVRVCVVFVWSGRWCVRSSPLTPSSADIKKGWSYTSTPLPAFMACQRDFEF
jgi:hypothetical protein